MSSGLGQGLENQFVWKAKPFTCLSNASSPKRVVAQPTDTVASMELLLSQTQSTEVGESSNSKGAPACSYPLVSLHLNMGLSMFLAQVFSSPTMTQSS